MKENKLLDAIEEYINISDPRSNEHLQFIKDRRGQFVSVYDAVRTFIHFAEDLTLYADAAQAVSEMRIKAIVASLPEDVQATIKAKFEEAEDDLLIPQSEGENN